MVQNTTYYVQDGVYYQQGSQGYVVVNAPAGAALKDLPPGSVSIPFGGSTYYYSGGVFYVNQNGGFVVVNTPMGITVSQLPPGATQININGTVYYLYNGIHYQPALLNGATVYTTVQISA